MRRRLKFASIRSHEVQDTTTVRQIEAIDPRQATFEAARCHPDHPLHAEPTHPFDDYVLEIMEAGNVWEKQTARALE